MWRCFFGFHKWSKWEHTGDFRYWDYDHIRVQHTTKVCDRECELCGRPQRKEF